MYGIQALFSSSSLVWLSNSTRSRHRGEKASHINPSRRQRPLPVCIHIQGNLNHNAWGPSGTGDELLPDHWETYTRVLVKIRGSCLSWWLWTSCPSLKRGDGEACRGNWERSFENEQKLADAWPDHVRRSELARDGDNWPSGYNYWVSWLFATNRLFTEAQLEQFERNFEGELNALAEKRKADQDLRKRKVTSEPDWKKQ